MGAGATIIHPLSIGKHAKMDANAVMLCDVPVAARAVAVSVKIINVV